MSELTLDRVSKAYGATLAVRDFSLAIAHGELVALLGPSGCGKTTTLRMIAGFILPSAGEIRIGGRDVTAEPPYRRSTGMVFQGYALFPHMSVAQNVAFGLEMRALPKPQIAARVADALRLVRLSGLEARYPRELSGGQQQRVALARALVINPDVLLLDEPLSNLDAKLRQEVRLEIRQLQRELGLTTVFVTHDQEEALTVADRLAVMNHGVIAQVGTPRELYDAPRSVFVADFIGKSNFFEGEIAEPGVFRTRSGLRIQFAGEGRPGVAVLAVRPERMAIRRGTAGSGGTEQANSVPGVTKVVTFLGPTTESMIELASGERVLVHAPTAQRDGAGPVPGEAVRVTWPPDASLLLDASDRAPAQIHEGELAMADAPQLQLTRRAFGSGAGALAGSAALGLGRARAQPATCVVGTWGGDYQNLLDANIVKPLLEPRGVSVQWDVAAQGPRKSKLIAERRLPRGTLDIACLSDVDMYDISLSGALDTLDESKVPNLKNAVAALRHPYAVPHIYSGMVLVYNPAHAQPKAYADLWDEKYRGKVGLVDLLFTQILIVATVAAGGTPSDFEPGKKKLLDLKKLGVRVLPSNEAMAQALQSGEVWITPMWRARCVQWQNAGIPVANVAPAEGAIPILFEFGVPKNAPDKEGAYAFLNASLEPAAQIGFAQKMGYAPTVANAQLPPEQAQKLTFNAAEQAKLVKTDYDYVAKEYQNLKQWWDREFLA